MCWNRNREETVSLEDGCDELQRDDPNVNDYLEDPTCFELVVLIVIALCFSSIPWVLWILDSRYPTQINYSNQTIDKFILCWADQ